MVSKFTREEKTTSESVITRSLNLPERVHTRLHRLQRLSASSLRFVLRRDIEHRKSPKEEIFQHLNVLNPERPYQQPPYMGAERVHSTARTDAPRIGDSQLQSSLLWTCLSPFADQVAAARVTAGKFITNYQSAGIPSDAIGFLHKWMEIGVYCLPAFLLVDVALVFVLSLVLFGRLRTFGDLVERRQPRVTAPYLFRNLSLPEWLLFAFVIGGLSPLSSGLMQRLGANVLALVTFLYLLQGLAIFRSFLAAAGAGFAGVLFAYVILGLLTLTGIAPLLLSIAGLFDSFFDFRKFNRKDHSDESHSD